MIKVIKYGEWTQELSTHDIARLEMFGLGSKCEGCSTPECEVFHPVTTVQDPVRDLRMVKDLLEEPTH